jgi:hypothetical protein
MLSEHVGEAAACQALGADRASLYRYAPPVAATARLPRPSPPRALSGSERDPVLEHLNCPCFMDQAPVQVFATLLDEGHYLCSIRTMYRRRDQHDQVLQRRNQLSHTAYQKPELLGSVIVFGHNVFNLVPNEVPILLVLGLLSFRLRNGGWSAMGLKRPASWLRVVQIASAAAILRLIPGDWVIEPLTRHFWPPPILSTEATEIPGNIKAVLLCLLIGPWMHRDVWGPHIVLRLSALID